ncbi:hypothetical protein OHA70_33460 [Kribbella sp. NBC_00382]|uniref:helix-turn-helix transcriptional regulator n=1 Tax=Kribbella sp. NBC_00382 TaxID=2975967 RepID=UPI002E21B147
MIGMSAVERNRLEDLLGEPLLAADPLIDLKQAAAVLDVTVAVVRSMLDSGALPRQNTAQGKLSTRTVRLADVLAWVEAPARINVAEAARILGESTTAVHRLSAVRLLTWHGGQLPLARAEVEGLALRRRNWLGLAEAAKALRVTPEEVHRLLSSGTLLHTNDVSRPVDRAQIPPPHQPAQASTRASTWFR